MKIVLMPSDMDAPGCYRLLFPGRQLHNQSGHGVALPTHEIVDHEDGKFTLKFTIKDPEPADIWVLQQRNERHWVDGGIQAFRQKGIAIVCDVDDNYLELPAYNPSFLSGHPYKDNSGRFAGKGVIANRQMRRSQLQKSAQKVTNSHNRQHMFDSFAQADMVTVSTPYLANLYERFNKNIKVIRNFLDWDIWSDIIPQYKVQRERPRIGWLATHRYRGDDIKVIANVIPKILKDYPNVDFVANSIEMHEALGVPPDQRVYVPEYNFWRPDSEYLVGHRTAVCDIGLVPMTTNGLNQGKSHLKGMEYNAAGIPFIATPTESYKDYWCKEGVNGYLADSGRDWDTQIRHLLDNDAHRRAMGEYGRVLAEQNSYQRNYRQWEDAYLGLLGDDCTKTSREAIVHLAVQKVSELSWMLRKVKALEPKVVVEVGSAGGGTFWSFAQVATEDATLVSIDMEAGSPLDQRGGKDVYQRAGREKLFEHARAEQKVVLLTGDSQTLAMQAQLVKALDGKKIDFLFLDADHRYEGVKRDFELYSPLVRPGGLIGFHDIDKQNDPMANVQKLWKEVKRDHESFEFFGTETWGWGKWGGIGILRKGQRSSS